MTTSELNFLVFRSKRVVLVVTHRINLVREGQNHGPVGDLLLMRLAKLHVLALTVPAVVGFSVPMFASARMHTSAPHFEIRMQVDIQRKTGDNVEQIKDTQRDKVMTFSYDMSIDTGYEKPVYKGTGNGLGGDDLDVEYDIIVIGSGMGGLACGALSQEYGSQVAVLESHIKPGGSAHTFTRVHNGGKYSFEVGPSIFEGLEAPSQNPNAHAVAATCLHNIAGVSTFPSSLQRCARNET